MPAFQLPPDSNVTLKPPPPSSHQQHLLLRPHIYLALAALAVGLLLYFASRHLSNSNRFRYGSPAQFRPRQPGSSPKDPGSCQWDPVIPARTTAINGPPSPFKPRGFESEPQRLWAAGLLPPLASPARMGFVTTPGMGDQAKDRSRSRGVSTSATDLTQQHPSPSIHGSVLGRRSSRSPPSSRAPSSSRIHNTSSDGSSHGKGSAMTDDDARPGVDPAGRVVGEEDLEQYFGGESSGMVAAAGGSGLGPTNATPRQFSRPPLPPPLTPPTLSTGHFTFEDRRPSYAVSIPPQLDSTFIHQPNPDYLASSTAAEIGSSSKVSTTIPRRRSYTRTVPIGIPAPLGQPSSPRSQDSPSSETFSPSSYPPTSPRLPPPPPSHFEEPSYEHDGPPQEIDMQGEIISVMDDAGHGWKRHTRVYGGGVCLACQASGRQGGTYGDRVPLEERR